jgi:hypothetical protein
MTDPESMSITLPEAPVDGYEIRLWSADGVRVTPLRYVYHVNRPAQDVEAWPFDDARGHPFVDQWACYSLGSYGWRLNGRHIGWMAMEGPINLGAADGYGARSFPTEAQAVRLALAHAAGDVLRRRRELRTAESDVARLVCKYLRRSRE